jgi:probable DNA repair protein
MKGEIAAGELLQSLAEAPAGTVVVTPNRRLSQALVAQVDQRHVAVGSAAWVAPEVLPFDAFVARLWDDVLHSEGGAALPLRLSEVQEQALWEEAIAGSRHGSELFAPGAAASQCRRAWSLAHEWRLADRLEGAAQGEDARAFVEWSGRYARLARERGMTDAARLPDLLFTSAPLGFARVPRRLVLHGFDGHPPQRAEVLARLQALGCEIVACAPATRTALVRRRVLAEPAEELAEAACWARARLEAQPSARIGIVVPDLPHRRAAVHRAFARVLSPGYLEAPADAPLPFELSLGVPLAEVPLVADALSLLRLCGRQVAFEVASRLLRSPFLVSAQTEAGPRARLDAALRERLALETSLEALLRLATAETMPRARRLVKAFEELSEHRRDKLSRTQAAGDWARAFTEALRIAGFPGERALDSSDHQAWEKWHEVLAAFATLERVAPAMRHDEACARLERLARETVFQPEGHGAPVHVLGVIESAGLQFDHLWVCGLTDEAWPRPLRPHALLPLALQRQAGIPQADNAASLALDRRITQGWLGAATEVVLSHARMHGDGEVEASPLVAHVQVVTREELAVPRYESWRERVHRFGRLERLEDGRGSPAPAEVRGGGTSLFRNQAACPFRAFAVHRLGSRGLVDMQPGLAANDRGTLLHEMLRATWQALGTRERLLSLPPAELDALLDRAAEEALGVLRRRRAESLGGRFGRIEKRRLVGITREWLELERGRADFEVEALEHKAPVTVGGITVNARLDRQDRIAGGRAVIDYKTSKRVTVAAWLGPRPDEPQLPLYALAGGTEVKALAFAQVRPGALQFCGVAREAGLLPKVGPIEANKTRGAEAYADWDALVAHWRREMESLAGEFLAGEARVSPKSGAKTCALCDQQPLCRVAEKAPAALAAEGEEP